MEVGFDVKDLLVELRNDVRAIDQKLEMKADRERVHSLQNDLAAVRLELVAGRAVVEDLRRAHVALEDHDRRLERHEDWRNFVRGGFAVSGLFFTVIGGLMIWVLTNG